MLNAHGVRGLLKAEAWCDSPRVLAMQKRIFLAEKDGLMRECRITRGSVAGGFVLLGIEGIETREAAIALKNKIFFLKREDIPVPQVLIALKRGRRSTSRGGFVVNVRGKFDILIYIM